ncbi:MAG: hypothetical protein KQH83_01870 [Actinobacteria bacterium]|nr:hypothetical protein [Actinomycetota bacterium]
MDIAVNLVESYLRLSGYLTLSEFEVQRRSETGYETVTDVDIMALRLPGDVYAGDPHGEEECRLLLLEDPVLDLEPGMADVIIGEVKQGAAEFNPGIRRHVVLHSMLRRVGWLYDEPIADVVRSLQDDAIRISPARGGGSIRTRLVAFGRAPRCDLHTISHTHIVQTLLRFFEGTGDAFKPVQFRDPAPAMLSLLLKTGFEVKKDG